MKHRSINVLQGELSEYAHRKKVGWNYCQWTIWYNKSNVVTTKLKITQKICNKALTKKRKQLDEMINNAFDIGDDNLRQRNKGFLDMKKVKVKQWDTSQKEQWLAGMVRITVSLRKRRKKMRGHP